MKPFWIGKPKGPNSKNQNRIEVIHTVLSGLIHNLSTDLLPAFVRQEGGQSVDKIMDKRVDNFYLKMEGS